MSYFNKLNVPLGTWFGVGASLHWTFTIAVLLVAVLNPHYVLLLLSVFFIILLHEGGHVIAGRRVEMRADHITLTPIGGMAVFDSIDPDPKKEFVMTIGGPLVNVALILPLYVLSLSIPFFGQVAYYNIVLLVFNLIPAFPSDGGRLLRSGLTYWMKDYLRATDIACRVSQAVCIVFGVVGIITFNFTLIVVALFLFIFADRERQESKIVMHNYRVEHPESEDNLLESADILARMQKRMMKFRKRHKDSE